MASGSVAPVTASWRNRRILGVGELGRRLIVAFIGVVLATLLLDVVVVSMSGTADFSQFARAQEVNAADTAALTAGAAFDHGRWDQPALTSVIDAADMAGAGVQVLDSGGRQLVRSGDYARLPATGQVVRPVVAQGASVGQIRMRFGARGLRAAVARLDAQRWRARIVAFVMALALATAVSVLVARRITAPLERLLAAVRARGAGDRQVRITDVRSVGVIHELLQAFNAATDALDERDRARRELVGNVAHELRTPVAILQAGTESMLDGFTEPTEENVGSLHEEAVRLSQRLDDLQALARADSATLQLALVHRDLAAIARDAADRLRDMYEVASVRLQLELQPVAILCDYQRMVEVVTNLMTNALKYTRAGGTVTVETGQCDLGGPLLRITDTGIGIPADELPRVTERFFRGADSSSIAAGSGIGLTIVSQLVRAQRGILEISSEPGSGTQVMVTFPKASARRLPSRRTAISQF